MLEIIPAQETQQIVTRFAGHQTDDEFLRGQELNLEQIREMKALLHSRRMSDSLEDFIDEPFNPKRRIWRRGHYPSRFSDGSFPVLYFSLETETAEAEVKHRFCSEFAGNPSGRRRAWFSRFTCDFQGEAKDLRPMESVWNGLTHGSDYAFCNELGAEAVAVGLDGLLAPSVRKAGGTNLPVFARRALSNPREHSVIAVTCKPTNGTGTN